MKPKIAIFDFCDTLVNFQSADKFVQYVKQNSTANLRISIIEFFRKVLIKTRIINILKFFDSNSYINKRLLLFELKGFPQHELERLGKKFFEDVIIPGYIPEVVEELFRLKHSGWTICIASGGYDVYLSQVKAQLGIDFLICTSLKYHQGIFTGRFNGKDCLGNEKLSLIIKQFGKLLKTSETICFSDSITDLALLKYCNRGIVVCKTIPNWVHKNNLEVLCLK